MATTPAKAKKVAAKTALDEIIESEYQRRHGKTAGAQRKAKVQSVGRAARSGTWRWRYQLAPLAVIGGVWLVGVIAQHLPNGARLVGVGGALASAGVWFLSRRWLDRDIERVYATACLTGATAWLLLAALVGLDWQVFGRRPLVGALWVGGVLASLPWWRHFRIRPGSPTVVVDSTLTEQWDERVAAPGRALPGSCIIEAHPVKVGTEFEIRMAPGVHQTSDAVAATGRITSAFERTVGSVVIEPSRSAKANRARGLLVDRNLLDRPIPWPGPHLLDRATGLAPIGPYADGDLAPYRFYRPGSGPLHDLISGSTDSGKSRLIDQLLAYERHSGFIVSLVIDPQRGQSVPDWKHNVQAFAGSVADGLMLLRRVEAEMDHRNDLLSDVAWVDNQGRRRTGIDHFDPFHPAVVSLGLKLWVLTIEEAHTLLAVKEAADIVQRLVAMARKCGIKVRLVTQVPLLSSLGGRMEIRDAVASGNVVVLRTANGLTGQVALAFNGTLPVQPHHLPKQWPNGKTTAGIGYTMGAADRPAMMRCHFVEDPYHWATTGEPAQLEWLPVAVAEEPARPAAAVASAPVVEVANDGTCRVAVVAAMKAGARKRGDIINDSGYSVSAVQKELASMVTDEVASKTSRGEYELAQAGVAS